MSSFVFNNFVFMIECGIASEWRSPFGCDMSERTRIFLVLWGCAIVTGGTGMHSSTTHNHIVLCWWIMTKCLAMDYILMCRLNYTLCVSLPLCRRCVRLCCIWFCDILKNVFFAVIELHRNLKWCNTIMAWASENAHRFPHAACLCCSARCCVFFSLSLSCLFTR